MNLNSQSDSFAHRQGKEISKDHHCLTRLKSYEGCFLELNRDSRRTKKDIRAFVLSSVKTGAPV